MEEKRDGKNEINFVGWKRVTMHVHVMMWRPAARKLHDCRGNCRFPATVKPLRTAIRLPPRPPYNGRRPADLFGRTDVLSYALQERLEFPLAIDNFPISPEGISDSSERRTASASLPAASLPVSNARSCLCVSPARVAHWSLVRHSRPPRDREERGRAREKRPRSKKNKRKYQTPSDKRLRMNPK